MSLRSLILIAFCCLPAPFLQAQILTVAKQGYMEGLWTEDSGLPENSVLQLILSQDGFIWGATYEGLIRFDGLEFKVFDKSRVPHLRTNQIYSICEDANGSIWMGTNGGGVTRFNPKDGSSELLSQQQGQLPSDVIRWVAPHPDGSIWIAHESGLSRYHKGNIEQIDAETITSASRVMADSRGDVWVAHPNGGVFLLRNQRAIAHFPMGTLLSNQLPGPAMMFAEDRQGRVWAACQGGLFIFKDQKIAQRIEPLPQQGGLFYHSLYYDQTQDEMWVGTIGSELLVFNREGQVVRHFKKDQTLDTSVNTILKDPEGNIWFGMYKGGMRRLQQAKFKAYSVEDGLSDNTAKVICEGGDGSVYIGTNNLGISKYKDGVFEHITTKQGLTKDNINALWYDHLGNIWAGTYHGYLNKIAPNGKITVYDGKKGLKGDFVSALYEDMSGRVWIGTYGDGLFYIENDQAFPFIDALGKDSFRQSVVRCIYQDRQGLIWVGTNDGLFCIEKNIIKRYTTKEGLSYNMAVSVLQDKENDGVWIGTRGGGLNYFKDGKFYACTMSQGLFNDVIHAVLDDGMGKLWMSCNKGIFTLRKQEFYSLMKGEITRVHCEHYGKSDGMLSAQCNGGFSPAAWRASDGKMWFPTVKGVVVIDPSHIITNPNPPVVLLEAIEANGQTFFPEKDKTLDLGLRVEKVIFHYAAINYTAGEKVRYKYMLEGYDKDWIDAGSSRMVYYTSLPYGNYTFKVTACNNDGVWHETGASVAFMLPAPIWQQPWFYSVMAIVVIAGAAVYIRNREATLVQSKMTLEELVREKTEQIMEEKEKVEAQNLALTESNQQIAEQKATIERVNEQLTDSIRYARRIQDAMLPSVANLNALFLESFLFYMPRNIVSGDFFWLKQNGPHRKMVVADCTGHGVPGAFMTVMGINFLNEITHESQAVKLPHQIMEELDEKIIETLNRNERGVQDGMDMSMLHFDTEQRVVHFCAAKNPVYYVRNGELHLLEANRSAIGGNALGPRSKAFATQTLPLQQGDVFYLFSDGFQDQFGGKANRKFMVKRFREMIHSISYLSMEEQKATLQETFMMWKGDQPQTDDVLIVGIRWT